MPPKGYKKPAKPAPMTANDYACDINLCDAAAMTLTEVAKKHRDVPEMLAALSLIEQGRSVLRERERQTLAGQRPQYPEVAPLIDADRPEGGRP